MKKLVLSFLIFCQLQATAQLNIVNGGSTPSGSGWSITGNTLTVTGNVSIDADIITQHLLNTGDLEVNVTSPAATITISEAITYAGATTRTLTLRAGAGLSVNADVTMNGGLTLIGTTIAMGTTGGTDLVSSTNGQISLLATQHITNSTASTITTQGGHVLLASNTDDATDGESTTNGCIRLINGVTITTNGGNITLGGGDATGSGYAVGSSAADFYTGIRIDVTASFTSGGGNIVLRGKSYAISTSNTAFGVGFWSVSSGTTINSGTGTVTLDGFSNSSGADGTSSYNSGIFALNPLSITSSNTTANAIQLIGKATTNNGQAWGLETESSLSLIATGEGGGITVSTSQQRSGDNFDAVFRGETNILAKSGPIRLLGGQSGGIANNRLFTGNGIVYIGSRASSAVTSSTSDVLIQYDMYYFTTYPRIATTGTFTWQPTSASFGQGVQTIWFVWNQNSQTIRELIIGKPGNTQNITHDNALTVAGPISMYGGTVAINADLTSSADGDIFLKGESGGNTDVYISSGFFFTKSGGTGTLTLQGDGGVALHGAIITSGTGVLNTILWSDYDNTNDGGVRTNGRITTNGGHVWLGGSSTANGSSTWNGLTVGDGPSIGASGSNNYAIDFFNNITTNGGDLFVWAGDGVSGLNGINTDSDGATINSGSGDVTFIADRVWGNESIGSPITLISTGIFTFAPHGGSWPATMSWSHGGGTNINLSSYLEYLNINNFASLGGLQLGYYTGMSGMTFTNTSNVTIASGLTVAGPVTVFGGTLTLNESIASTASGDISLYGNAFSFASTKTLTSAGQLLIAPSTFSNTIGVAGSSGNLSIPDSYFTTQFTDGFSNIIIGSDNQTGNITTRQITLRDNVSFRTTGTLTLDNTSFTLGAFDLTLGSSVTVAGTPTYWFKTTGSGSVKRSISNGQSLPFPVGNSTYNPVTLTNNNATADVFSARVADEVLLNGTSGTAFTEKVVNRTWHIGKTNPNTGSGVNFQFEWDATQELPNIDNYTVSHYGTFWTTASGTQGTVSGTTTKTLTLTGYTGTFSPFAIGSNSVLPVSWLDFTASRQGSSVQLNWSTASEQNTRDFVVQHRTGSGSWENIGTIPAAGNSNVRKQYGFVHTQPKEGRNLYRILQRDIDQKESISKTVSIQFQAAGGVQVYPLPVTTGSVSVKLPSDMPLKLFNTSGMIVREVNGRAGIQQVNVEFLPKGIYYLKAGTETIRVLVQ